MRSLIGPDGELLCLGLERTHTYRAVSLGGKADTGVCVMREGTQWKIPNSSSPAQNDPLWSTKVTLPAVRGLQWKNLLLKEGEQNGEVGWDCPQSKLPHTALGFLEVSQFNLLTFGFHFQKRIHWMTQSDVLLDLLIFYNDAAKRRPSILDTWDLWPVINLVKIMNCHRKGGGRTDSFPNRKGNLAHSFDGWVF